MTRRRGEQALPRGEDSTVGSTVLQISGRCAPNVSVSMASVNSQHRYR